MVTEQELQAVVETIEEAEALIAVQGGQEGLCEYQEEDKECHRRLQDA